MSVRGECLGLLALLADSTRRFQDSVRTRDGRAAVDRACRQQLSCLPKLQHLLYTWKEEATAGRARPALHCLALMAFLAEQGASTAALRPGDLLREVEVLAPGLGDLAGAAHLQALRLFHTVTLTKEQEPGLVASLCTAETLRLLVAGAAQAEEPDRRATSGRILGYLLQGAGLGLANRDDTMLLLGLLAGEEAGLAAALLRTAVMRREDLRERVEGGEGQGQCLGAMEATAKLP